MKISSKQILMAYIASVILTACATVEEGEERTEDLDYRGADCIWIRTIRDYTPLDRSSLLIHTSGKRSYFVQLLSPAHDMRSSFRLAYESRDDRLCPFGGDALRFGSISSQESRIRSISRLTAEQQEDLLIRYGKKKPEELQDPAPPDVKGAEVEELGSADQDSGFRI